MISEDIIERVRLSTDIVSVIREYLPDLKRAGRNWKARCPFHNEKTPSFVVNSEKGIYKCFGCNASGDVFKFVKEMDNISWVEAVKKLAQKANIEIKETVGKDSVKRSEKTKLFEILESSARFYHRHLLESQSAKTALAYLQKRGVNSDSIKKFQLGYAPRNQLLEAALKKGNAVDDLLKAGLITKTERGNFFEYMSERLVFPIFDVQGRVVAFGGRTLDESKQPKYLNTPETAVYSKSSNLYGLFQTLSELRKERKIIMLEGYLDVVIPQQFGIAGAVASLGTAFTQNHAKLIARHADSVKLLYDSDDAGRAANQRALEILIENGVETTVSALPENIDADEFLIANGVEAFVRLLEDTSKSAIDFMLWRICAKFDKNSSEGKQKAAGELLTFVAKSRNNITIRDWIKKVSQTLNLDENLVWLEFKKQRSAQVKSYKVDEKVVLQVNNQIGLSIEESLLRLITDDKNYINRIQNDIFQDAKCSKVYALLISGAGIADILNAVTEDEKDWFSSLTLINIEYKNKDEVLNILLKDIEK
ncbi:MAG: DNA primase, partial [Endomicrobium sp.]|nr:DNA primase [Endomicrobium sp.]